MAVAHRNFFLGALLLSAAIVTGSGCSGDSGAVPANDSSSGAYDAGSRITRDKGIQRGSVGTGDAASGGTADATSGGTADATSGNADATAARPFDSTMPSDVQRPSSSRVGAICTDRCTDPDEICIRFGPEAKGICLRKCSRVNARCDSPDPNLYLGCGPATNPEVGTVNVCLLICEFRAKRYPCPNETGYTCRSFGGVSGCVAK